MSKQHTQKQKNTQAEQSDLELEREQYAAGTEADEGSYGDNAGAESGGNRAPRVVQTRSEQHKIEPASAAYEGSISSRTPQGLAQGITSHSAEEESARQEKVVKDRPDAQAGVNHSQR